MELHDNLLAAVAATHRDDLVHDAATYRARHDAGRTTTSAVVRAVRRLGFRTRPVPTRPPQGGASTRPRAA